MRRYALFSLFCFGILLLSLPVHSSSHDPGCSENDAQCLLEQNPTAEQLLAIESPTSEQFALLTAEEQEKYIRSFDAAAFSDPSKEALATLYFTTDVANVNDNPDTFILYLQSKGIDISIFTGTIKEFTKKGALIGKRQSINIHDFTSQALQQYAIDILEGEIVIHLEIPDKTLSFTGDLSVLESGLSLRSGSLNGYPVENGAGIRLVGGHDTMVVQGFFTSFAGITFAEPTNLIADLHPPRGEVTLNKAVIADVSSSASVFVKGEAAIQDFSKFDGSLRVAEKSSFILNGVEVRAIAVDVALVRKGSSRDTAQNVGQNKVQFSNTLDIEGSGFKVIFTPYDLLRLDETFDGMYHGYLSLPETGAENDALQLGDKGPSVELVQRIVGVKPTGEYSPPTQDAVRLWKQNIFARKRICLGEQVGPECRTDGDFDENDRAFVFDNSGSITLLPQGGKISVLNDPSFLSLNIQGNACQDIGGRVCTTNNGLARDFAAPIIEQFSLPVHVRVLNEDGDEQSFFEKNYKNSAGARKLVKLGGTTYPLSIGEAYIVTVGQSAFTTAVAPPPSAEELALLPDYLKQQVAQAGHMLILYVEETGEVRVTESSHNGVTDKPFDQSSLRRGDITGMYSFVNADSQKIIEGAKKDAEEHIGWFFTDLNPMLAGAVNKLAGQDYSSYRSCAGHVCMLAEYGGADLREHAAYLPVQNTDPKALERYLKAYAGGALTPEALGKLSDKDKAVLDQVTREGVAGKTFHALISLLGNIHGMSNALGGDAASAFATPGQILLGNLKNGIIEPVLPTDRNQFEQEQEQRIQERLVQLGYHDSSSSSVRSWQQAFNNKWEGILPVIPEDGEWGDQTEVAFYLDCSTQGSCE